MPADERDVSQDVIIARIRRILAAHPGYAPIISARNPLGGGGGGGGNFAIQASLLGPDITKLYDYSQQLLFGAQQLPSIVDAKSSYSNASPEVHVAVDRARAADLGVRISTIGSALRLMVSGDDEISTFRDGGEQYPVKIRVLESQRRDVDAIGKLTVPSSTGQQVRIDNIAQMVRGFGPTQLRRQNRQFAIDVQGDIAPGHALDEASNDMRRLVADLHMPPGYTFRMNGQTQILDETTANLIMAIGLASIFVYIVLAAQFESFIQPIIIMLVLPVSVPFALFTIWVTGRTLNLWSALGILLLFGIVKKNSILQVDYTNVLRARGVPIHEAIVEACRTRLRPILMTTSAIIAGPDPDGARHRHRRQPAVGDRDDDHRRPGPLPVPHAAAGAGRLRAVRHARTGVRRRQGQGVAVEAVGGDVQAPPAARAAPLNRTTPSDRRPVLAIRVLEGDSSVVEGEEIAAVHLDAPAILLRAGKRPFRHTAIARDEMPRVGPVRVRKCFEYCGECGANRLLPLAPLSDGLRAGRGFEHAVVGHHAHQRVEIVAVPRLGEAVQQLEQVSV